MELNNMVPAQPYVTQKLEDDTLRLLLDEEKMKSELARLIRSAREQAGLNQRELAEKAHTTQAVVARLELGTDSRMPSLMLIARLLKASNAHLELKCVFDRQSE